MLAVLSRGVGAVALVGALSFSFPVSASASTLDVIEAILVGSAAAGGGVGVVAAAPEVGAGAGFACAATLPVCAAVALTVVGGVALYSTRDTWMPWVSNGWNSYTSGGAFASGSWGSVKLVGIGAYASTVAVTYNVTAGGGVFQPGGTIQCLQAATGARWQGDTGGGGFGSPAVNYVRNQPLCSGPSMAAGLSNISAGGGWQTTYYSNGQEPYLGVATWGTFDAYTAAGGGQSRTALQVSCTRPDGTMYGVTGPTALGGGGAGSMVVQPACNPGDLAGPNKGAVGRCVTMVGSLASTGPLAPMSSNCGAADVAAAKYPNCVGVGQSACTYVLRYKGVPCAVGVLGCSDWTVKAEGAPADYACYYGPYPVALGSCALLERIYEPGIGTIAGTADNTDGNPRTWTGPTPVSQPAPGSTPVPLTSVPPVVTPNPSDCASGQACVTQPAGRDCFPGGVSAFNPAEWVLMPVKCALSWAFVPDTATLTSLTDGVKADVARTGIPAVASAVAVPLTGLPGGNSGCAGPGVSLPQLGQSTPVHPFSACAEPIKTAAAISYALSTVVIVVGGGLTLMRLAGAGFGYNVAFKGGGDT